jgi:hypothetical protein
MTSSDILKSASSRLGSFADMRDREGINYD